MYIFISDRSTVWTFGFELDVLYKRYFGDFFGKKKNYEVFYTWVLWYSGMTASISKKGMYV